MNKMTKKDQPTKNEQLTKTTKNNRKQSRTTKNNWKRPQISKNDWPTENNQKQPKMTKKRPKTTNQLKKERKRKWPIIGADMPIHKKGQVTCVRLDRARFSAERIYQNSNFVLKLLLLKLENKRVFKRK